jgi:capsular exopolysaccharide synthesis family protein
MQHLAAPNAPNNGPAAAPPGGPTDSRKLLEDAYRCAGIVARGWRFLVIGLLVAMTAAALHIARLHTSYKSTARLLVIQQGGRPVQVGAGGDPFQGMQAQDSLGTHLMVIKSPVIVEEAINNSGLKNVSVGGVVGGLTAKLPEPSARVIELSYKSDSAEEASKLMECLVQSYKDFLRRNYQKNTNEVIGLIVKARDELNDDLKSLEKEYLEYKLKNPAYSADDKGRTFIARRLDQWDQAMNQVLAQSLRLRSQLELGKKLSREGVDQSVITNALNQLGVVGGGGQLAQPVSPSGSSGGSPEQSYASLTGDLAELESRRRTAELLSSHLKRQLQAEPEAAPASDKDLARAFYNDPDVAPLQARKAEAEAKLHENERRTRNPSDPSVKHYRDRVADYQARIDAMWEEKREDLARALAAGGNPDVIDALRKAEAEVVTLKAREAAVRERLTQVAAEQTERLRRERGRLVKEQGADSPLVHQVDAQLARLEGRQDRTAPARNGEGKTEALLDSLERSLESIESMRNDLQKKFEEDMTESKSTEIARLTEDNLRSNLDRQKQLFNSVVDQLKQAQLVSDFGSVTAQTIDPPSVVAERPKTLPVLAIALLAGCGFGVMAAFVADVLDARIRTLSEIRTIINLPVIGLIPQLRNDAALASNTVGLLSHETPRSGLAESYKTTRTNLEFVRKSKQAQVLLISSPHPGDGKSTTASNMAITLANTGRRVLLVDGDLRKPSQHLIYKVNRERGFSTALEENIPIVDLVTPTQVPKLDLLTTGPDVPNPAELLASHRLSQALEDAKSHYDTIIIDSSPLLAVTDPSIIASVADALILVVRVSSTRRHDLERTTELLHTLGVEVLGMVINGVTRDQMGYGYGAYGYGGYGYGYGYGYGSYGSYGTYGREREKDGGKGTNGSNGRRGEAAATTVDDDPKAVTRSPEGPAR